MSGFAAYRLDDETMLCAGTTVLPPRIPLRWANFPAGGPGDEAEGCSWLSEPFNATWPILTDGWLTTCMAATVVGAIFWLLSQREPSATLTEAAWDPLERTTFTVVMSAG